MLRVKKAKSGKKMISLALVLSILFTFVPPNLVYAKTAKEQVVNDEVITKLDKEKPKLHTPYSQRLEPGQGQQNVVTKWGNLCSHQ